MNKSLDKLEQQIQAMFDKVTDKADVDALSQMKATLDEVKSDTAEMQKQHTELLGAYSEAIKHASFKPKENEKPDELPKEKQAPDFEDFVKSYIKKREEEKKK